MLSAKNIDFEYSNTQVLRSTSFSVSEGEKIALVGPNGVGKSTLLKIMAGLLQPTSGNISHPKSLNIGYMPQEIDTYQDMTGADFLSEITGVNKALGDLEAATAHYATKQTSVSQAIYQEAYERVESLQAYTLTERMGKPLAHVELDEAVLSFKVRDLSGGQKTKLALAAILLSKLDVFLLDEPTNSLDMHSLGILEDFINKSESAFVIVSHDRWFIKNACKKIAELLPSGDIKLYTLGYDEYIRSRTKARESALQTYENYLDDKKRLKDSAREKVLNANMAANNDSSPDNDKQTANFRKEKAATAHARAAAAISTRLDQLKEPDRPEKKIDLNFRFKPGVAKLPSTAVRVASAELTFERIKLGPYSLNVNTGEKIIVVGPNGGGKSSFLKLIAGKNTPSSGNVVVANGINIGYIYQDFSFRFPDKTVLENIKPESEINASEYYNLLAKFGIVKDKADLLPSKLSPGQRAKALLAELVAKGTNLILMDEPTNHLDISTSDELQNALKDFGGTLVVVTHDRELINALETKKIIVIDNGTILVGEEESNYLNKSNIV